MSLPGRAWNNVPGYFPSHFEIVINVPSRTLQLKLGPRVIREYPVGVGYSKDLMTPPGRYKVDMKVIDPIWEHPYKAPGQSRISDPSNNPLGRRWIGFHSEGGGVYGMHGTNTPSSVGKFVSHGCVRMYNEDVEELFEYVNVGTPVTVTYERFEVNKVGQDIFLKVYPDPYGIKELSLSTITEEIAKISPWATINEEEIDKALSQGPSSEKEYLVASIPTSSTPQRWAPRPVVPYAGRYYHPPSSQAPLSNQSFYYSASPLVVQGSPLFYQNYSALSTVPMNVRGYSYYPSQVNDSYGVYRQPSFTPIYGFGNVPLYLP